VPPSLLLKVILTPALIASATLVGRRWGETMSGWLVGLPLTSGPVLFFLALDQGTRFAAAASLGVILGVSSQAIFALAYIWLGGSASWQIGVLSGSAGFALATVLFQLVPMPAVIEPLIVAASLLLALRILPSAQRQPPDPGRPTSSDLPLRVIIATGLVIGLTSVAPALGARLSGLISPFPLYAAILAIFGQRSGGFNAALAVWRGLLFGLFSFLAFFTAIAASIVSQGIAISFLLAVGSALAVQGMALVLMRIRDPARS
jgi:hypothetical protein